MTFRRWMRMVLLGPAFMFGILAVPEGEGEGESGESTVERPDHISEEEWDSLSGSEREGVLMTGEGELGDVIEDDDEDLSDEELAAIAGGDGDGEGAGEGEATGEQAGEGSEAAGAEAGAEGMAGGGEGGATTTEEPVETVSDAELLAFRPNITAEELRAKVPMSDKLPDEVQAKLDELDDRYEKGWEENGEQVTMSLREYNRQRDAITRQANQQMFNDHSLAMEEARAELEWDKEQAAFFSAKKEYDTSTRRGKALFGALNETVQELNSDKKWASKTGMQVLLEAHRIVSEEFGLAPQKPAAKAAAPAEKEKPKEKPPAAKPTHKTLSGLPEAAPNATTGDPFSALDNLSGEAFERALERLTPDQRKAYEDRY